MEGVAETSPASRQDGELTIDELARETGLTVRNIRAYQSRGLIPSPAVRARTGYYGAQHLERLRRIRGLQAEGFNLRAIQRLLDIAESGGTEEALRFQRDLLGAFSPESGEVVDEAELEARFGGPLDPELMRKAGKLGALAPLDDGRYEVTNPTLVRAAGELAEIGIPFKHALAVGEAVVKNSRLVAREFVRLFVQDVLRPIEQRGAGESEWAEARAALERLSPLAGEAVNAAFEQAMARAVQRELDKRLGGSR